jgi:DNA repair protein SbcC/Rad50
VRLMRLELCGFGAFREHAELDLSDVDFFALVGPTGSGKSTVIDAVCFSLYGCVPRYEDQRLNRYVVTLGSSEARVSMTFELEGITYIASRIVRRSPRGQFSTKEARLERIESDGSSTVLAGAEREMNPAVVALLKLSFDDFTKCVVLPQGEFAEFLRASGEKRRDLLLRLLNLEVYLEVGRRAGQTAEIAKASAELHRRRLVELAGATPEALATATLRAKALDKLNEQAEKARPKIEESLRLEGEEGRHEAEARRWVQLVEKLTVPEGARKHGARLEEAQRALLAAQEALIEARGAREKTASATDGLPDLGALQSAAAAHDNLSQCVSAITDATPKTKQAHENEAEAKQAVLDAEAQLAGVSAELRALETAHLAEGLAERLIVGEACPVCLQVVRERPSRHAPQALSEAKRAEIAANSDLKKLREALDTATKRSASLDGEILALTKQQGQLQDQVKAHPDKEKLDALIADTKTRFEALGSARKVEDAAQKVCQSKQSDLDGLAGETETLQKQYNDQRDSVALLGPPASHADLVADWDALVRWGSTARSTQESAADSAAKKAEGHRGAAKEQTQRLIDGCIELNVDVAGDIVAVLTALAQATTKSKAEVEQIAEAIAESKTLETQIADLSEQAEVASLLRSLLRADRFPEWLVREALELLVEDASTRLRALTNDGFSLALGEREFMVIDHANADEERSARTLSGGETFQASLALALALSDQIRTLAAEGAPLLDALFLDEGFGTLDPETLDTVAGTIENLGQSGRMVGIITHVRELATRVPVRFEVHKGPRSSVVEKHTS